MTVTQAMRGTGEAPGVQLAVSTTGLTKRFGDRTAALTFTRRDVTAQSQTREVNMSRNGFVLRASGRLLRTARDTGTA
jgi:hypothetical protein